MVNTFITSSSLVQCAKNLDYKRLGKQRVEAKQIIDALDGSSGWSNHPVVKMWIGHSDALKLYFNCMVNEWVARGYQNNMPLYDVDEKEISYIPVEFDGVKTKIGQASTSKTFPWYFQWQPLIYSHQAALIRKFPDHYLPLFKDSLPKEYLKHGYIWPKNLKEDALTSFNLSTACSSLGSGVPSHFRIPVEDVILWNLDKSRNPKTGKTIKSGSALYTDYMKAYNYYKSIHKIT